MSTPLKSHEKVLLELLLSRDLEAGKQTFMYGIQVTRMDRDQLIATIGFLHKSAAESRIATAQIRRSNRS